MRQDRKWAVTCGQYSSCVNLLYVISLLHDNIRNFILHTLSWRPQIYLLVLLDFSRIHDLYSFIFAILFYTLCHGVHRFIY